MYTIPAGRLLSKNLNGRSATVTIVPGNAASQTIVVFVNRAVNTQQNTDLASNPRMTMVHQETSQTSVKTFAHFLRDNLIGWIAPVPSAAFR